jgi:hypothetical protein
MTTFLLFVTQVVLSGWIVLVNMLDTGAKPGVPLGKCDGKDISDLLECVDSY